MIYLIITTSLENRFTSEPSDHRKARYIESIQKTLEHLPSSIQPILVENNGLRETYLDTLGIPVHYTKNNEIRGTHKGVNELEDIKSVIEAYSIKDDDMIIKLTGRYHPTDDTFFRTVLENPERDAFVCFFNVCRLMFMEYDCVLGLFGLRCKLLKEFSYSSDYKESPEVEFARYTKALPYDSLLQVNKLGLRCCFADDLRILDV